MTLAEIQDRAASFDPLTLRAHEDVRAISSHAWFSLGRHGVGLHFQRAGRVSEVLVVRRAGRGKCWEVVMDGRPMERFSRLEAAVEAVDFELERMGRATALSAKRDAAGAAPPIGAMPCAWRCGIASTREVAPRSGSGALWGDRGLFFGRGPANARAWARPRRSIP